ncbi:hypothetical protein PYCC9005_002320 [Savitreella phatthalungensis]
MFARWFGGIGQKSNTAASSAESPRPATQVYNLDQVFMDRIEQTVPDSESTALNVLSSKMTSPTTATAEATADDVLTSMWAYFQTRQRRHSGLTERYERLCPRRITFQAVWETVDRIGRARVNILPYIVLDPAETSQDVGRLIAADQVVTEPCDACTVRVDFPLRHHAARKITPRDPSVVFRRAELCLQIANLYADIYRVERGASQVQECFTADTDGSRKGLRRKRRNETQGPYGIYEYALSELMLGAIIYDPGSQTMALEVEH